MENPLFVETSLIGSELPEERDYDIRFRSEFKDPATIMIYIRFLIEDKTVSGFTAQLDFEEDQDLTTDVLHEAVDYFVATYMNTLQDIDRIYFRSLVSNYNADKVQ